MLEARREAATDLDRPSSCSAGRPDDRWADEGNGAGSTRVHVATRNLAERERALALGTSSVGGYDEPPPRPLDAAVTFAPVGAVVVEALRAITPGGTVVINAIHLDAIRRFDCALLWEERGLRNAPMSRAKMPATLPSPAEIRILTQSRTYCLEETNMVLSDLAWGHFGAPAAVMLPDQRWSESVTV